MADRRLPDYKYRHIVKDSAHFIHRYIEYAGKRTSAAWDLHEGMAIMLLSLATQGIKWRVPFAVGGLRTNLYIINHGRSSYTKKSTVMDIAKEIQTKAMPGTEIPENFTPGALEEILAEHSNRPTIMWADEFQTNLEKMQHQSFMAGLRGMILTLYGSENWSYQRVSKGKNRDKKDEVEVTGSHLCIVGNTTPAIGELLHQKDLMDGFLARFAIIAPSTFPPKFGLMDATEDEEEKQRLIKMLREIRDMVIQVVDVENRHKDKYDAVLVDQEAITVLDEFDDFVEGQSNKIDEVSNIMIQRLPQMAMKVSILCAVGHHSAAVADHIHVTEQDARWACKIVGKWMNWANKFVLGMDNDQFSRESAVVKMLFLQHDGEVTRSEVSRRLRVSKRTLDDVQMTLLDRGDIRLREKKLDGSPKPTLFWISPELVDRELNEAQA